MAAFLSPDWLELQREAAADLPERPGASATVQHVVTGAPGGNVVYVTTFEDGQLVAVTPGPATDPDLTFTLTYEGAKRVARGELELGAAFMQGTLKVEGSNAMLLPLLEWTHRPSYRQVVERVATTTEF
jgi:SCP-2 sterol transfer family